MSIDVGARLRYVRELKKISQRQLSKKAGVTNSTISLIESNQMNPSIGALKRILDGVPMSLADFFSLEPQQTVSPVFRAHELVEIGKGRISYRQVGRNLFGHALQILHERYQPGSHTGRVKLVHEGDEGGVVIRGRLELTVDGERHILGPGDAYLFKSQRPHSFRCVGPEVCEVISACSPPTF